MADPRRLAELRELDVGSLVDAQLAKGRLALEPSVREHWGRYHRIASQIQCDSNAPEALRRTARLLETVTFPLATAEAARRPNYYDYINSPLLDWFVGDDRPTPEEIRSRSILGCYAKLSFLREFELESLAGRATHGRAGLDENSVRQRVRLIERAIELAENQEACLRSELGTRDDRRRLASLTGYAAQESRLDALRDLSCFPLSDHHDEVAFLRVVQASEFCFLGLRACVFQAVKTLRNDTPDRVANALERAADLTVLLHGTFGTLRTMPARHFLAFRPSPSGLESINYHLLEIHLRGVNPDKAFHYARVESLRPLLRFARPDFVSLRSALRGSERPPVVQAAIVRLERCLLKWRALHLAFARKFIPDKPGSGGTEGVPYLRAHLDKGLLSGPDTDAEDLNEILEMWGREAGESRLPPTMCISPHISFPDVSPQEPAGSPRTITDISGHDPTALHL